MSRAILELELRGFLLADPAIAAIVGDRIYPDPAPQNAVMPFITLGRVSALHEYDLDGYAGQAGPLIQIDCWADAPEYNGNYGLTKQLGLAVKNRLNGYIGPIGVIPRADAAIATERDIFDPQDRTRRASIDFRIWHDDAT